MTEIIENETHNLPVNFSELTSEEKQVIREQLYNFSEEPNFGEYSSLENYHILHYVEDVPDTGKKGDELRNHFKWDVQALQEVCESENMDFEKVNALLNPEHDLSYTEVEEIFDGDVGLIMKTMTLLVNNYRNSILQKKEELFHEKIDSKNYITYSPHLLFNLSEEKLFLTGMRLLDEYNNDSEYPYINDLTKKTAEIIMSFNKGLIIDKVSKHIYRIPFDDLYQQGRLGILHAIAKFDIDTKSRFSTYAKPWVDRYINLYVVENYSIIYHPHDLMRSVFKFKRVRDKLRFRLEREPTFNEVVKECERKNIELPGRLDAIKLALEQTDIKSLDKPLNKDTDETLLDSLEEKKSEFDIDERIDDKSRTLHLLVEKASLTHFELQILEHNLSVPLNGNQFTESKLTVKEFCKLTNITPGIYYYKISKALGKLKKTANLYNIDL